MNREDLATTKFRGGYNCAQSVASAFVDRTGLNADTTLKAACGFGGGMGRKQEVCGAVTGGIIVLGLVHGRGENEGKPAADLTYAKVRELMDRFAAECGSCVCRTILGGCNLLTEEGQKQFKEKNLHETTCVPCVATAVRIVESLL